MTVFRLFAGLFLLVAAIALVSDYTSAQSFGKPFSATPLAHHWGDISPSSYKAAKVVISRTTQPWVWDQLIANILSVPSFILFGLTGLACAYIGRRRRRTNIYAN